MRLPLYVGLVASVTARMTPLSDEVHEGREATVDSGRDSPSENATMPVALETVSGLSVNEPLTYLSSLNRPDEDTFRSSQYVLAPVLKTNSE